MENNQVKYDQIGNRAVLYGESIFTTIRCHKGIPLFYRHHRERLLKGVRYLWQQNVGIGEHIDVYLKKHFASSSFEDARIRITVSLDQDSPNLKSAAGSLCLHVDEREIEPFSKTIDGISVRKSNVTKSSGNIPSFLKRGYYLDSILELRNDERFDDIIFCTDDGKITEASTSNIFMHKNGVIMTPRLSSMVLDGVTRKILINAYKKEFIEVLECDLFFDDLINADNVWLCNAISMIKPIKKLGEKHYKMNSFLKDLYKLMEREIYNEIQTSHSVWNPAL